MDMLKKPAQLNEDDIKKMTMREIYSINYKLKNDSFNLKSLLNKLDQQLVEDLCCLSYIIGMCIPGEFSIFSTIDIYIDKMENSRDDMDDSQFILKKYRKAASYGEILAKCKSFNSKLGFFFRPSLKIDNEHSMQHDYISGKSNLKDKKILVIGGSTGIGYEVTKLFLKMGAKVTCTYYSSKNQAHTLKKFDSDNRLNIAYHDSQMPDFKYLEVHEHDIIFDCSTPKIGVGKAGDVKLELIDFYMRFYIKSFCFFLIISIK